MEGAHRWMTCYPMGTKSRKETRFTTWPTPWAECLTFGERMPRNFSQKDGSRTEFFNPNRLSNSYRFISFFLMLCLGKEFAYRQMKILSIVLLRYFRFKLSNNAQDAAYRVTITLHMKGGLHVCATPRTT
ncbi:hypothetical protein V6N13_036967 [Hibiscus sabdariffa]|uniref:Uncharacterized protein n=1 Tax=Hibiscus sabdariffa TaxID=183260 RepID=A0ABR2NJF2_9ROSI